VLIQRKKALLMKTYPLMLAACMLIAPLAFGGGFPANIASGRPLFAVRAPDAPCTNGDLMTPQASPCFATVTPRGYRFFVEVPPSMSNLTIEIFDPDVGLGGAAEATAGRDSDNNAVNSAAVGAASNYEVFNPAASAQATVFSVGNATLPAGSDNQWQTLYAVSAPATGVWEVRVTGVRSDASVASQHINYFGVRACATAVTSGNARCSSVSVDLNVFARSFLHLGNQNSNATNTSFDDYTLANGNNRLYPWATHGCSLKAYDFDADTSGSTVINLIPRNSRPPVALTGFSGNATWNSEDNDGADDLSLLRANQPIEYGIWGYESRVGDNGGNHISIGAGSELTVAPTTSAPQNAILSNSFRFYLPQLDGAAPKKPRLIAQVTSPGAIVDGSVLSVTVAFENPTPYPVNFGAVGNLVSIPIIIANVGSITIGSIVGGGTASFSTPNVSWNPGVVPAGATESVTFTATVLNGAPASFNVTAAPSVTSDDVGATLAAGISGANAIYLDETNTRFRMGPICQLSATRGVTSTPAVVAQFEATRLDTELDVRFVTAVEAGTVGYDILQLQADGSRKKLTTQLIPSNGTSYSVRVRAEGSGPLLLEELSQGAQRTQYGPYPINQRFGENLKLERRAANTMPLARSALTLDANKALLKINAGGLQRVTGAQLRAAGVNFVGARSADIALTRRGIPAPRLIEGGDTFTDSSAIAFYAELDQRSLYGPEDGYSLQLAPNLVRNVEPRQVAWVGGVISAIGLRRVLYAPNALYNFSAPLSDPWYAASARRNGAAISPIQAQIALPGMQAGAVAEITTQVWGALDYPGDTADHAGLLRINGAAQAFQFDGMSNLTLRDTKALPSATVALSVEPTDSTGFASDIINLESVQIDYPGALIAQNGALDWYQSVGESGLAESMMAGSFEDAPTPGCVAGDACSSFSLQSVSSDALLLKIGVDGRTHWLNFEHADGNAQFSVPSQSGDRFVLASRATAKVPLIRAEPQGASLFGSANDLLIISHPAWAAQLGALVQARQQQGLRVQLVDVEQIYGAYSDGAVRAEAIALYVKAAHQKNGTRSVLLVGADQYDYSAQTAGSGMIPGWYRASSQFVRFAPSDAAFGDFDLDGVNEVTIGRFPVRTELELANMIGKTLALGLQVGPKKSLLVSDRSQAGYNFAAGSATWNGALSVGATWQGQSLALDNFENSPAGVDVARNQLQAQLQTGVNLLGFAGHSSPYTWTNSGLLSQSSLTLMLPSVLQPMVLVSAGCWGTYDVNPEVTSLARTWLVGSAHGAAAMVGASAVLNTNVGEAFYQHLYRYIGAGQNLGDAINAAKRDVLVTDPSATDALIGIALLGDPSVRF
jgi:hypothetical protein